MDEMDVNSLLSSIDDLIDLKILIRRSVPRYELDEESHNKFILKLKSLQDKLTPIFSKYLKQDFTVKSKKDDKNLIELILNLNKKKNIFLVSANSGKKKLKTIGIDPRNIIVTGGPLLSEDYKIINPQLTENALSNIKKKCDTLKNEIEKRNWKESGLVFIYEDKNITDKLILEKINIISDIIGKNLETVVINLWRDLEIQ